MLFFTWRGLMLLEVNFMLPTYLRKMLDIMNIEVLVSGIIWPTFNGVATKCYLPADDVFHSDFFFSFRYLIEITSDFLIISDIGYILIKIQVTFQTDHQNFLTSVDHQLWWIDNKLNMRRHFFFFFHTLKNLVVKNLYNYYD